MPDWDHKEMIDPGLYEPTKTFKSVKVHIRGRPVEFDKTKYFPGPGQYKVNMKFKNGPVKIGTDARKAYWLKSSGYGNPAASKYKIT